MLSSLAADRARLADLEAQISELERSLSELKSQKNLVVEQLGSYKYPILTLPNETTIEIFIHFPPTYPLCPPLKGLESPTLLTQICRQWRGIALETPALWRAISMSPSIPCSRLPNMWLSRSRHYPLSFDYQVDRRADSSVHAAEVMSALAPHRARWEHLGLQIVTSLLHGIEGPMPLLRSLNLRLLNRDSTQSSFLDAPLLRTAILNDYAAETLTLPWAQLTSLTLYRVFPRECVPILRHASSLVYCELDLVEDSEDVPDITLPYLRSLTLTGNSVMRYLETLIIPALHDLCVPESFLWPKPTETLSSFMSKSGCTLGELCITSPQLPRDLYYKAFTPIKISFD